MPQVSRRKLNKEVANKIFETLLEAVSQMRSKSEVSMFINDLLSPVERTMIAKRLAIAVLLLKRWDYPSIKDFLKVSNATVSKVSLIIQVNRGYKEVVDKLTRTEAGKDFWRDILVLAQRLGVAKDTFADEKLLRHKLGIKKKTLL